MPMEGRQTIVTKVVKFSWSVLCVYSAQYWSFQLDKPNPVYCTRLALPVEQTRPGTLNEPFRIARQGNMEAT